jgi:hypothetical protein
LTVLLTDKLAARPTSCLSQWTELPPILLESGIIVSRSVRWAVSPDRLLAKICCATVLLAGLVVPLQCGCGRADEKPATRQPESRGPRIAVSTRTTRILQPLDGNGYVDYVAALNQRASQGVTPQNNAGVLFVQALGLNDVKPADRARIDKLLQIEPTPVRDDYLAGFDEFFTKKRGRQPTKKEDADFHMSTQQPWSASEFPLVAEWLAANKTPLEMVVEGTRRPKCYLPLVEPGQLGLLTVPLTTVQATRSAARALAARAMLRLHEGKVSEAEQDLLACHRLARLVGSTPFLIAALVGIAIDSVAFEGDVRLMEYAPLSAEAALAYQQALRNLPPLPVMADVIDASERFVFLDTVLHLARSKQAGLEDLLRVGDFHPVVSKRFTAALHSDASLLDWDAVLEVGNAWFDRAVAAARKPSAREQKKAIEVFDRELRDMRLEPSESGPSAVPSSAERSPRHTVGREIGKVLTVILMPSVSTAVAAEGRARMRDALDQVGFALVAYRADHGTYPESLNVLPAKYIARLPQDFFTEQPLRYKRQGGGFLLYSVGSNGVDDGGRTFDSQPPGDDIVLRIAPEAGKNK